MRTPSDRSYPARLRRLLRDEPDGLAVAALCDALDAKHDKTIYDALHRMPDAYIDRWEPVLTGGRLAGYRQVWRVVDVPPHTPRPGK